MKNLLLIEDDENFVYIYKNRLEKEGFTVKVAFNGEDGLAMALKDHPDMVLLDILLPKMDGMVVMSKLREDVWGKTVPIIIFSVLDPTDEMTEQITKEQPTYYLLKSTTNLDSVIEKIKEVANKIPEK